MKTKIKIVTLMLATILGFGIISDANALWYSCNNVGGCALPVNLVSPTESNCVADSQPDAVGPTIPQGTGPAGDTGFIYTQGQTQVLGGGACQWWDSTAPTASALTYANATSSGWQKSTTINLSWSASDTGGSGLKNYDIKVYSSNQVQSASPTWGAPIILLAATTTTSYAFVGGVNGFAYKFEIIPHDVAGNTGAVWTTSSDIARIDTVTPVVANVVSVTNPQLLANTIQSFSFTYPNDGGAPVRIASRVEDFANSSLYLLVTNSPLFTWAFTSNQNISLVDGSDRIADGNSARQYTYQFTQICDQAGNCWNGTRDFNYNVYANPNSVPVPLNTQDATALGGAIADGVGRNFVHTIKDGYGNAIIPATGINRVITMTLSGITNTMYLNQYTRGGVTSVYARAPNNLIDDPLSFVSSQSFASPMTSVTGSYPLTLKVYTPTATGYSITDPVSDPLAAFGFTTNLVVNDTLIGVAANKTFSQTLSNPSFTPLYTTNIAGDLRDGGFIEGTEQTSNIVVNDNNIAPVSPSSVQLQLEFSGSDAGNFNMYGGSIVGSSTPIVIKSTMVVNPGFSSTDLYTKLLQKPGLVATGSNLQLSTHFSYTLDSKSIVYNSDIVGKDGGYWSNSGVTVGNQVGIKVIGPIASNSILAIINDQFATETSIFNGLSRVIVRDKIRKSITTATRNVSSIAVSSLINSVNILNSGGPAIGSKIEKDGNTSLIRIEKTGGYVTLNIPGGISGKRTLVIKGADLYITNNMYYSSAMPNSILGVVVQKNEAGQGGNLYIDPSVTNIVGTYVIDGSIMSSSGGSSPIGTSNIALLKNQLYIYGSIVSENTIGGSRMSPLKCPSLVNTTCSTIDEAQKYDLNYLRRYYLYNNEPFDATTTKVVGGATCPGGICGGFIPNLITKFTTTAEDLARYPVIVEYNPMIRINPPIGFE